jgi:hypothetical protein
MSEHDRGVGGAKGDGHQTRSSDVEAAEIEMSVVPELVERYRLRARRMARAQYLASKATHRMHNRLGIPVVVLSAVVGTSIFATLKSNPALGWVITIGLISLLTTTLAALQTFFGFGARAQQHKMAGARYSSIRRSLDLLKLHLRVGGLSPEDALAQLTEISGQLDETDQESPDVPDHLYDRARQEEMADDEGP